MVNKYYRHSRISEGKFRQIVRYFVADYNAAETAIKTNLDRKSINGIFLKIRRRILESSLKNRLVLVFKGYGGAVPCFMAESEAEFAKCPARYESRVLIAVFENGSFRSEIICAETKETFAQIKRFIRIKNEKVLHYGFYDAIGNLALLSHWDGRMSRREYFREYSGNLLLYFLGRSKKFKGVTREKFILHLRESEWRFNKIMVAMNIKKLSRVNADLLETVTEDLYKELLEILRDNPLQ